MIKKLMKMSRAELLGVLRALVIALALYFALFMLVSAGITPQRYDIQVGVPAPVQLKATKDVEDVVTTEAMRDEAAGAVEPTYKNTDSAVTTEVLADLTSQFTVLRAIRLGTSEQEELGVALTSAQMTALTEVSNEALNSLFSRTETLVRDALLTSVPEGHETATINRIQRDLSNDGYEKTIVSVMVALLEEYLQPNMLIDEETTEMNRQRARDSVEPEMVVKSEVIVREGEIVTPAQFAMLKELGLTADNPYDVSLILGVALFLLLLMVAGGFYLYYFEHDIWRHPATILLLSLVFVTVVALSLFARELNVYLMPAPLGLMLFATLIRRRLALFMNFILTILVSLLASASSGVFTMTTFTIVMTSIISAPFVVSFLRNKSQRTAILTAGLLCALCSFLTTLAIGLVSSANINSVLTNAVWSIGGAILSAVLCLGFQPLLEWMFNLTTSTKLMELSNPNQPLLRRMMLEAPGSYHHSIIVANLAETAADEVGANGLLARVGAYYHDIGKLKRPLYFKENQIGDNPHDRTDPRVSAAILAAHTRDGYQSGQKARLPESILDIVRQHHGDTPMLFFYDKAKKLFGDDVDVAQFRYEGPRPQSKEAAIVMLADSIEAAARSMPNPDPEKLDQLIRKLVYAKMNDGQLNQCDLTFKDLDRICRAFLTVLSGVFHERIEYPDVAVPPRPAEPVVPAEEAKPAEAAKPAEEKPAEAAKPAETAKAAESKPAEQSAEVESAAEKPAESEPAAVKTVETAKESSEHAN